MERRAGVIIFTMSDIAGVPWIVPVVIGLVTALSALLSGSAAWFGVGRKRTAEHEDVACAQLRRSFENSYHGKMIVNRSLIILKANSQARKITGYGVELEGMSIYDLILPEFRERHRIHVRRFFADPHTRRMGDGRAFPLRNRQGDILNVYIALSPYEDEFGSIETTVEIDVVREDTPLLPPLTTVSG
jgi:PAS domain S-box-containing protein